MCALSHVISDSTSSVTDQMESKPGSHTRQSMLDLGWHDPRLTPFLTCLFLVCLGAWHLCFCTVRLQCLWRPGEGVSSSGTRVTSSSEPPWMLGFKPRSFGRAACSELLRISTGPSPHAQPQCTPSFKDGNRHTLGNTHEPTQTQAPELGFFGPAAAQFTTSVTACAVSTKPSAKGLNRIKPRGLLLT